MAVECYVVRAHFLSMEWSAWEERVEVAAGVQVQVLVEGWNY